MGANVGQEAATYQVPGREQVLEGLKIAATYGSFCYCQSGQLSVSNSPRQLLISCSSLGNVCIEYLLEMDKNEAVDSVS